MYVSSDPAAPPAEDTDATLLRQLALARKRPDGALREQLIMTQLLGRHVPNIRRVVAWRAYSLRPSDADIDDIVNGVLIRVADALRKDVDASGSLGGLIAVNIECEVIDHVRRRRRFAREVHPEIEAFPDPAAPDRYPTSSAVSMKARAAGER